MGIKAQIIDRKIENIVSESKRVLVSLNTLQEHEDLAIALLQKYDLKVLDDGMDLIHAIPEFRPHLIMVESDLKSISGFQVTHLLKSHPDLSKLPLILLLTHGYQIGEFWSKEIGVDLCQHTENLDPSDIVNNIDILLEKTKDVKLGERSWLRIEGQFTGAGFVESLSNSLDHILMESSVLNRIALLAQEPTDLRKLIRSILFLLRNILEYSAGSIQIFKSGKVYSFIHKDMSENDRISFIKESEEYSGIYNMTETGMADEIFEEVPLGTFQLKDGIEQASPTIFTLPLDAPQKTLGTITLLTHKSIAKREYYLKTLELITPHIALTLNNALLYKEVHELSTVDELTSLPNRRAFYEIMQNELVRSRRYKGPISLAILDIDHFKLVNDTYGHLQGDKVLQECAKVFRSSVRDKIDTVARFGGEEFIVLFPQTNLERSKGVVERLHRAIQNHSIDILDNGGEMQITVSIGLVSIGHCDDTSIDEIINAADKALYEAKDAGRNRIVVGQIPSKVNDSASDCI